MKNILLLILMISTTFMYGQGTFDFGISKMNRTSGTITSVIDLPGTGEFNPAWSPDRRFIAFDVVSPVDPHRIGLSTSSGSLVTIFAGSADGGNNPTWSADGSTIAVDKVPFGDLNVYGIDVATGVTTRLVPDAVDPAFSHKGGSKQFLSFTRPSDGMIYTYHVSSGTVTPVTPGENAKWSPNDKALVFSLGEDVFTIGMSSSGAPSGSPVLQAGDPTFTESRPDWLSNNEVIFHANYSGDFDIYRKRTRGSGAMVRIGGNSGSNDFDPDYHRSGRYLLFAEGAPPAPAIRTRTTVVNDLKVSPTCVNNFMQMEIHLSSSESLKAQLYSLNGELLWEEKIGEFLEGEHSIRLELMQNVLPGMYVIRVRGNHSFNQSRKIVKM